MLQCLGGHVIRKMIKKRASSTLYFILFFIIFLAFCAFAVDGTIVFTNRAKLQGITETAALAGAEMFNSDNDPLTINPSERTNAETVAKATFDLLKQGGLKTAKGVAVADTTEPKITLTTSMVSQPFFLSFLGVSGINLSAQAIAKSEQMPVYGTNTPSLHWATKRAVYQADVIENDSVVVKPLGDFDSQSFTASGNVDYGLIRAGVTPPKPLSLGPGGFVTIKLPVPIINKTGPDLQINEIGNREGYMVFAGLDKDPNNPYIDNTNQGSGLSWVNISCAGDASMQQSTAVTNLSGGAPQVTVYGSGNFDLDANCLGTNVNMVKYIRIVDDNKESAYINGAFVHPYGESSSPTPGADIESVKVLNYVHLTQ